MYRKVVAQEFNNYNSIKIETGSLDELRKGLSKTHSIIKLHASVILFLDTFKLQGLLPTLKAPFTLGSDGAGTIVESKNKALVGKKVAFHALEGSFSEYLLVSEDYFTVLQDDADLDSAACVYCNSLTASGLIGMALKKKAKGVVNLAATSAIGKMINELAKEYGLTCLNVIRGDQARVEAIKKQYHNENVISVDENGVAGQFGKQIKEFSSKLSATVCFDPVGGATSGVVFNNLPAGSTHVLYGYLEGKTFDGLDIVEVLWASKQVEGFNLYTWLRETPKDERAAVNLLVSKKANSIFRSTIEKAFSFEEAKLAFSQFSQIKGGKKFIVKPVV